MPDERGIFTIIRDDGIADLKLYYGALYENYRNGTGNVSAEMVRYFQQAEARIRAKSAKHK